METKVAERIQHKLKQATKPAILEIVDESYKHAGHAGARPGGESHFKVKIVSEVFEGLNRVRRHQLVHEVLAEELREQVHALSLQLLTPAEAGE